MRSSAERQGIRNLAPRAPRPTYDVRHWHHRCCSRGSSAVGEPRGQRPRVARRDAVRAVDARGAEPDERGLLLLVERQRAEERQDRVEPARRERATSASDGARRSCTPRVPASRARRVLVVWWVGWSGSGVWNVVICNQIVKSVTLNSGFTFSTGQGRSRYETARGRHRRRPQRGGGWLAVAAGHFATRA